MAMKFLERSNTWSQDETNSMFSYFSNSRQ